VLSSLEILKLGHLDVLICQFATNLVQHSLTIDNGKTVEDQEKELEKRV